MQPDAVALRERLLAEPTIWPERSALFEITHGEMEAWMHEIPVSTGTPLPRFDTSLERLDTQVVAPETTGWEETVIEVTPEPAMEPLDPTLSEPSFFDPNASTTEPSADPSSEPFSEPLTDETTPPSTDPSTNPWNEFDSEPTTPPTTDPTTPWFIDPSPTPSPTEPTEGGEPPIARGVPGNPFGLKSAATFTMRDFWTILAGFHGPAASTYRSASAGDAL